VNQYTVSNYDRKQVYVTLQQKPVLTLAI